MPSKTHECIAGYDLRTVHEYGEVVLQAGFREVQAEDLTKTFISILTNELKYFEPQQKAFIKVRFLFMFSLKCECVQIVCSK